MTKEAEAERVVALAVVGSVLAMSIPLSRNFTWSRRLN